MNRLLLAIIWGLLYWKSSWWPEGVPFIAAASYGLLGVRYIKPMTGQAFFFLPLFFGRKFATVFTCGDRGKWVWLEPLTMRAGMPIELVKTTVSVSRHGISMQQGESKTDLHFWPIRDKKPF
jgi:hypothetical protein